MDPESKAKKAMKRRDFLKSGVLGAGAAATMTGCGVQEEKLIPLLIPEENILPGVDRWKPSTCALCSAGCGIVVRSMLGEAEVMHEGQPRRQMVLQVKKIEGNPAHPVNRGKVCARGQAGVQMLYNPDRIQRPLKRSGRRGSGEFEPVSWDEALEIFEDKMKSLRGPSASSGLAAIVGASSRKRQELMRDILTAAGSARCYLEEPAGLPALKEANRRLFGRSELEVQDMEGARYVLSFGADILGAHTSPVRYNLGLGDLRQGRPGMRGKFVQVESRFSLTAANADDWLPARPGFEGEVALAMAHVILAEALFDKEFVKTAVKGFDSFRSWVLERFSPEKVGDRADISPKKIAGVAREFAANQPGVALVGGSAVAHKHGLFTAAAAHSLNALVGNLGRKGGLRWSSSTNKRQPAAPPRCWVEELKTAADSIQVLILWDADPLYNTPAEAGLAGSFEKVPFIVALSCFMDDSTAFADLILPDLSPLERWDATEPELTAGSRIISITQPIVKPQYEARDSAEVLLTLMRRWSERVAGAIPDESYSAYLKRRLESENVLMRGSFSEEGVDGFWRKLQEVGVWEDESAASFQPKMDLSILPGLAPADFTEQVSAEHPFHFLPFATVAFGEGRGANLPWMQELPDPMTSIVWGSWVELNPKTAAKLGVRENQLVWLESPAGKIKVPVHVTPAARPDVACVPFGQGHGVFGRYAAGRGANPWEILPSEQVVGTGEWAWADTRVKITPTGEMGRVVRVGVDREHTHEELRR